MKNTRLVAFCAVAFITAAAMCQSNDSSTNPRSQNSKESQVVAQGRGQQVFAQNCSRCHSAPEGFSPHISGTIARHMRVRASLSEADYKALMKFLNP